MRRLRRAQQKQARQRKIFKRRTVAAGTAAIITLGATANLNNVLAGIPGYTPDNHELLISQDTDGDLLADTEETAIGYHPFSPDQNHNEIPDGVDLAKRCVAVFDQLPDCSEANPNQICKGFAETWGSETCDICGEIVNMGSAWVMNPRLDLTVNFPILAIHYLKHGSFSYAGDIHNGRVDVEELAAALELQLPFDPNDHQLPVMKDADADLLANKEETAIGYWPFRPDQNRNEILDGVELAEQCAVAIEQLPWDNEVTEPNQTYKWHIGQYGLETCDICGAAVNMGPAGIVNPRLGLSVDCPLIAMHYMEHGSFSYAGNVHNGRIDLLALLRALELRFPCDPNDHQLPMIGDLDGDILTDTEELAAAYNLYDADQDNDLTPDGIELARQCGEVIDALPVYEPNQPSVTGVYKADFMQRGIETCDVCGKSVNMGYWLVINPELGQSIEVPDILCHYMEHGSFSYSGDIHGQARIDVPLLLKILEMPRRCGDLGTMYLPGDLNKDCQFDFADFSELAQRWLQSTDPNDTG